MKDWTFLKFMVFSTVAKHRCPWNEINCNCFRIPWRENVFPSLSHQLHSEITWLQNFFAKILSQQCRSATWYPLRRSQWQDITLGLKEFCFSLSQVAYFDLFSGSVDLGKASLLRSINADIVMTRVGVGSLDLGTSWLDPFTPRELMANHLTTLPWSGQLQSKMEIWDSYPENYVKCHLPLNNAESRGRDDIWRALVEWASHFFNLSLEALGFPFFPTWDARSQINLSKFFR